VVSRRSDHVTNSQMLRNVTFGYNVEYCRHFQQMQILTVLNIVTDRIHGLNLICYNPLFAVARKSVRVRTPPRRSGRVRSMGYCQFKKIAVRFCSTVMFDLLPLNA